MGQERAQLAAQLREERAAGVRARGKVDQLQAELRAGAAEMERLRVLAEGERRQGRQEMRERMIRERHMEDSTQPNPVGHPYMAICVIWSSVIVYGHLTP